MKLPTDPDTEDDGTTLYDEQERPNHVNSPKLTKEGKVTRKAIADAEHAHTIAKHLRVQAIKLRLSRAAIVQRKYDAESPFNQADLASNGEDWRSNFSTNFLGSIIDRTKPQLLDPFRQTETLTRSRLPDSIENSAVKSRAFQSRITKTIRGWSGWEDCLDGIAQEDVLHGCAVPALLSHDWRPRLFGYDSFYAPEGTGQHASKVQTIVFYERMLIHDFLHIIDKKEVHALEGYNIEGCIKAANEANGGPTERSEMDDVARLRELAAGGGLNYEDENKTVNLFHVVTHEYDGTIVLWTVSEGEGNEVRHIKIADVMEDAIAVFTMQTGNRRLFGSKGLGRLLANIHIALERGRCLGHDQMYLSGLVLVALGAGKLNNFRSVVRHPFVVIPDDAVVSKENVQFNIEAFDRMDSKLVGIGESIAGAFVPPNLDKTGTTNTKIEAAQRAEREQAVKQGVLGRFFVHGAQLITAIQRKICSERNLKEAVRIFNDKRKMEAKGVMVIARKVWEIVKGVLGEEGNIRPEAKAVRADPEAVECLVGMLEDGLSPQEIVMLALTPAKEDTDADGSARDENTKDFIVGQAGNPMMSQRAAFEMLGGMLIGKDRTTALMVNNEDPNVRAIATRQQIIEISEMLDGEKMPVASSDNHVIHREVLAEKISELMEVITGQVPTMEMVVGTAYCMTHYQDHIQADMQTPEGQKMAEMKSLEAMMATVEKIAASLDNMAAEQGGDPSGRPAPVNGVPAAAAGHPGLATEDPNAAVRTDAESATDITLRMHDSQLREAEHKLERDRFEHEKNLDATKVAVDASKVVAKATQDAMRAGQQDAALDLQQTTDRMAP